MGRITNFGREDRKGGRGDEQNLKRQHHIWRGTRSKESACERKIALRRLLYKSNGRKRKRRLKDPTIMTKKLAPDRRKSRGEGVDGFKIKLPYRRKTFSIVIHGARDEGRILATVAK